METSALRLTRWTTHILLALMAIGVLHAGYRLRAALSERSNLGSVQLEVNAALDELVRSNPFKVISDALDSIDTAAAEKKIKGLKRHIHSLDERLHLAQDPQLSEVMDKFADLTQESVSYSRPAELINTLSEKATGLRTMAQTHHWKNLTAYATRLESRLRGLRASGRVDSPQVRFAESDLASMERLTKTSALDEGNKQEVLRRLEGLRQELAMLSEVHVASRRSNALEEEGRDALARWLGKARLAAGALKTAGESRLQGALQEVWAIGAFVLLAWGSLGFLWASALRAQRHAQDQGSLEILREGLLNHSSKWRAHVGEARIDEVERTLRHARKRMGLGDDVQEALPFGALVVNQHGKVTWANGHFCDEFFLDRESVLEEDWSWEQIRRRLTGVPAHVVEHALKTMEAGTWQVQAEVEKGVCLPYEMHLTPIETKEGEGRKVFIVFYSMALMREAIQEQARLVASPIRAAIQALEEGQWGSDTETRLAPLWNAAGLGEDWRRLGQAIGRLDGSRRELLAQVHQNEDTIHDQAKMIQELEMGIDRRLSATKEHMQRLKELRDGLISLDQLGRELGQGHEAVVHEGKAFAKRTELVRETMKGLADRLQAAKDSVSLLERGKQDYRTERHEILESKMELMKLQNRFLAGLPSLSHGSELLAAGMKDQLLRLDEAVARLDSRLNQLDVQITKVAMACAGNVLDHELQGKLALDLSGHERSAQDILRTMNEDQERVIELLRDLANQLKHEQQDLIQLREGAPVVANAAPANPYPFL